MLVFILVYIRVYYKWLAVLEPNPTFGGSLYLAIFRLILVLFVMFILVFLDIFKMLGCFAISWHINFVFSLFLCYVIIKKIILLYILILSRCSYKESWFYLNYKQLNKFNTTTYTSNKLIIISKKAQFPRLIKYQIKNCNYK